MSSKMSCKTVEELQPIADALLKTFPNERIFTLQGELGAGKTTFIKAICNQLDVMDATNSPSFAIVNEYNTEDGTKLYHFDFYRLKKLEEVYDIGYEEYFYSGNYCFIEWPELVADILPESYVEIKIEWNLIDDTRNFFFEKR